MALSPKENYLRAIRFDGPEYVPNNWHAPVALVGYTGVNPEDERPDGAKEWTDFWGVGWRHELDGVMPFPRVSPLADPNAWGAYAWPDGSDRDRLVVARSAAERVDRSELILRVSHRSTVFERAWELVGMERLLVMMAAEPETAEELFEWIIQFQIGIARQYLEIEPEMAMLGDDLGTQLAPIFSPALFRKYLKPRYARLIELYKSAGVLVEFHSCGNVLALVDDFLELGIDVLNPIQPRAIRDLALLRSKTAGRIALLGGVDTQYTLTLGTPDEVRAEVHERIVTLGRDGGYICAPDQSIPMPAANAEAFERAVEEYGRYPVG